MSTLNFFKAGGASRARILALVVAYQKRYYPQMEQVNTSLYGDFVIWGIRNRQHLIGGVMIRQEGDVAEVHVIASDSALTDKAYLADFLGFLQYFSRQNNVKRWETLVRLDNHPARDALMHLGFTASSNNAQFIEYSKEGIVC